MVGRKMLNNDVRELLDVVSVIEKFMYCFKATGRGAHGYDEMIRRSFFQGYELFSIVNDNA